MTSSSFSETIDDMANQKEIIEAVAEILTLPAGDIDMEAGLSEDLGLNPVEVADLFHSLADKFQLNFESMEIETVKTVGDLVLLIEDKLLD